MTCADASSPARVRSISAIKDTSAMRPKKAAPSMQPMACFRDLSIQLGRTVAASDLTFRWPSPVTAQAGRAPFQHALSGTDIRHLPLTDLDLSCERLIVRRPGKRHVIYLTNSPTAAPPRGSANVTAAASAHHPASADQPMDRGRHHSLAHRHHVHRRLPAHRTHDADATAGPDPRRGIQGRRPAAPDALVRSSQSMKTA